VSRVGEQGRPTNEASTLSVMPHQRVFDGRDTVTACRRISPLFAIQSRASRVPTMGLMRGLPDGNPPETLLTRSVMHKKGKQNDYWERDS
jgi:hypothetical protein